MEKAVTSRGRRANILVSEKGSGRAVRVFHPGKLTTEDIRKIDDILINKVIFDLTGCSCLSGTIDVIWELDFENVLEVELGEAASVGG